MKVTGPWSLDEDDLLTKLRQRGKNKKTVKQIAVIMRRTEHSVEGRLRWLSITDETKEMRKRAECARRRALGIKVRGKGKKYQRVEPVRVIPVEVFIDRAERESAPRSLTNCICGDPPPGWSALDRRTQGAAA